MNRPEKEYRWSWKLVSAPEALWPLVSNTERFNRDCGFPSVEIVDPSRIRGARVEGARRLRARRLGLVVEWDERPFEWVAPRYFGVLRVFSRGPFAVIRARCELEPLPDGGTNLVYVARFTPAGLFGRLALAAGFASWQFRKPFDRVFRRYDLIAQRSGRRSDIVAVPVLATGAEARLEAIRSSLLGVGHSPAMIDLLFRLVREEDDLTVTRMRPYAFADEWGVPRRSVLELFLNATRAGLLDFSWDILCPLCRGAKSVNASLSALPAKVHCETCQIDYTSDFDRSVELTFSPNASVRTAMRAEYCIGGPQLTPHIVAQQGVEGGREASLRLGLRPGRYRVRSLQSGGRQQTFRVEPAASRRGVIDLALGDPGEPVFAPSVELTLRNSSGQPRTALVEHLAWADVSTTAAEVTALQLFRDLFTSEVLRPGERISVGNVTIVFTDLKGSTQMYRDIGDAPAFSRVLTHFDVLKAAVSAEGGALVKTMGDSIMAVFTRPAPALKAILTAQRQLALSSSAPPWGGGSHALDQPLSLKAGIHHGPCIAINQNDRLDYFGSTVNMASRLCGLSSGQDVVVSDAVRHDPEVSERLDRPETRLETEVEQSSLRGFLNETFSIWRLRRV